MADISKIKLPDGTTYNVKDTNAARTSHTQKADTISGGYLFTHPESSINATIIPFMNNDIAWLLKRGGSAVVKYDGVTQSVDISNVFDGSPAFWIVDNRNITTVVIELTLHKVFTWTNMAYCDFGSANWRAKSIKIEVMNTNYASDVWTTKLNITNNSSVYATADISHTPVGASNAGGGFNKIKFTFTDWYGIGTTNFRVAQLGIVNYNGLGLREPYMSRGVDDAVWRNISPASNNSYNLGAVSYKWANGYFTNINGVSVGDSPKFTDNNTTYTLSTSGNNVVLTPSSGSANTITVPYATNAGTVNNLTVQTAVPANAVFTDTKVTQTPTTDNHSYEVLLSGSTESWDADTTKTEGVYKNSALIYNPQINALVVRANSNVVSTDYSQIQIRPFEISCRTPDAKTRVTLGYSGLSMRNNDSTKTIDITSSDGDIETTGNIEASAISAIGISANSVTCNSMSVTDISSQYTITKSSGNANLAEVKAHRSGNVVCMQIMLRGAGSNWTAGSNIFVGTVTGGPLPTVAVNGCGYYDNACFIARLNNSGSVTFRWLVATKNNVASSQTIVATLTFITNN